MPVVNQNFRDSVETELLRALRLGGPINPTSSLGDLRLILQTEEAQALTWKIIVFTAISARAAHGVLVDPFSMKKRDQQAVEGTSYDARAVAQKTIGPFDRNYLGYRLGRGTMDPGANRQMFHPRISTEIETRRPMFRGATIRIVTRLSRGSQTLARRTLREAIAILMELPDRTPAPREMTPVTLTSTNICNILLRILQVSNGGESAVLVYSSIAQTINRLLTVIPHPVNQAGTSSNETGDVDFYRREDGENIILRCAEVKDRPMTYDEMMHACQKASDALCNSIDFVYGPRCVPPPKTERDRVIEIWSESGLEVREIRLNSDFIQAVVVVMGEESLNHLLENLHNFSNQIRSNAATVALIEEACQEEGLEPPPIC